MVMGELIEKISGERDNFILSQRLNNKNEPAFKPDSVVHIYLAATDRDLLGNVNKHLRKRGMMGLVDMSGRVQFVLDGRKGASFAASRFGSFAEAATLSFREKISEGDFAVEHCIDNILRGYCFRTRLRGYALLRRMLHVSFADPALMRPATKRLYPLIAEEFRVSLPQIERNLRYLIQTLLADEEAALAQGASLSSKRFWLSRDDREGKPTVISTLEKLHNQVVSDYKSNLVSEYKNSQFKESKSYIN